MAGRRVRVVTAAPARVPRARGKAAVAASAVAGFLVLAAAVLASRDALHGMAARWWGGETWCRPRPGLAGSCLAMSNLDRTAAVLAVRDVLRAVADDAGRWVVAGPECAAILETAIANPSYRYPELVIEAPAGFLFGAGLAVVPEVAAWGEEVVRVVRILGCK